MECTVVVTGATGSQGGATARALAGQGATVHALVRNSSSPAALALQKLDMILFESNWDEPSSYDSAFHGATALFLNLLPTRSSTGERQHAYSLLCAAAAAGVKTVVYSSVARVGSHEKQPNWTPDSFMGKYWLSKAAIEAAVWEGGFENVTVLRSAFLMKTLVPPGSNLNFPELEKGVLRTAYSKSLKLMLVSEGDIGRFAAAAILHPEIYRGKIVNLDSEALTTAEIAKVLEDVSGKKIQAEEVDTGGLSLETRRANPILDSQLTLNEMAAIEETKSSGSKNFSEYGIQMVGLRAYLAERESDVIKGFEGVGD